MKVARPFGPAKNFPTARKRYHADQFLRRLCRFRAQPAATLFQRPALGESCNQTHRLTTYEG